MKKLETFFNELLLNSGQYALFYIIMNFSRDKVHYFDDKGHGVLLFVLIGQTIFLTKFGNKPLYRILGSIIAPIFYTITEYEVDYIFVFNIAHIFFWIFSLISGGIQAVQLRVTNIKIKKFNEYAITFVNISIFIFIYFYFDLDMELKNELSSKTINYDTFVAMHNIFYLEKNFSEFLQDSTHIFIIIGGIVLAFSIALGRIKILLLNERINFLFGKYIGNNVRDKIVTDGHGKSEKIELCILFSDIRNFTGISEKYEPEEITSMLNLYFTEWSKISKENNGIIDKYIGDAVMIVFGKIDSQNPNQDAVKSALKMLDSIENVRVRLARRKLPILEDIGIGIHYGTVIAGDIGGAGRVNYTYIGDSVNIASRLESSCKDLHKNLVISKSVYDSIDNELKNKFQKNEKEITLKGLEDSKEIYYL